MPTWTPASADKRPHLTLANWRAFEVQVPNYDAPSWHLVGYVIEEHCGKVSAALASVDASNATAATKTGRTYGLGISGEDSDAAYVWETWKVLHGVEVLREVTQEVLAGAQPVPVNVKRAAA